MRILPEGILMDPPLRDRKQIVDDMAGVLMLLFVERSGDGMSVKSVFRALERDLLIKALLMFNGHQQRTASFLGLSPTTLGEKLKKHQISIEYTTNIAVKRSGDGARLQGPRPAEAPLASHAGPDREETGEFLIR
jgi:DNA-binding protein Fis